MEIRRDVAIVMLVGALLLMPGCNPGGDSTGSRVLPETFKIAEADSVNNGDTTTQSAAIGGGSH